MRRPYRTPVVKASPDVKIPEPRVSKFVIFLLKILGRLYLFVFFGVAHVVLRGGNDLFLAFKRALAGESRLIIAFRHPNGGEPQLLAWFFLFKLRVLAARQKIKFARQPHAIFVYGYEVVRWGGWAARFIMPQVGALPIHHAKLDSQGMARIYRAITEGSYPLALAPEGQVSYTIESVPRLEQGAIRIGFNAAARLDEKGSKVPVEVLPVAVHFRFGPGGAFALEHLIRKIEKFTGIRHEKKSEKLSFSERIGPCRERILEINEERYHIKPNRSLSFEQRLETVINAAMGSTERILGIKSQGDFFSRMYYLRQICWDRIVLPGVQSLDAMPALERGTADLLAGEAWHAGRHLELVDFCWYFRIPLLGDDAPLHEKVEYVQNLWDFINRTIGGAYSNRINILPRKVIIRSAPVINLSERLPAYRQDKTGAMETAMEDLKNAYLDCIKKVNQAE